MGIQRKKSLRLYLRKVKEKACQCRYAAAKEADKLADWTASC